MTVTLLPIITPPPSKLRPPLNWIGPPNPLFIYFTCFPSSMIQYKKLKTNIRDRDITVISAHSLPYKYISPTKPIRPKCYNHQRPKIRLSFPWPPFFFTSNRKSAVKTTQPRHNDINSAHKLSKSLTKHDQNLPSVLVKFSRPIYGQETWKLYSNSPKFTTSIEQTVVRHLECARPKNGVMHDGKESICRLISKQHGVCSS